MELRKLIVNLRKEDELSINGTSTTLGKSKSGIHSILRKLEETGSWEAKKPVGMSRKTTAMEDRWIGYELKKDNGFETATANCINVNTIFGSKISRHTISRRLNKINLNIQVAFTKPYISKRNKMTQVKFANEQVI